MSSDDDLYLALMGRAGLSPTDASALRAITGSAEQLARGEYYWTQTILTGQIGHANWATTPIEGSSGAVSPLDCTNPLLPTLVKSGVYTIAVIVTPQVAAAGKVLTLDLLTDADGYGWGTKGAIVMDPRANSLMPAVASSTTYIPAGGDIILNMYHDAAENHLVTVSVIVQQVG